MTHPEQTWDEAAQGRDLAATERDSSADVQDRESDARDERAEARDVESDSRERASGDLVSFEAGADRAAAARDRRAGRRARGQAEEDRVAAASDRALAARDRVSSAVDPLTRAYRRDFGTFELSREVLKAKRNDHGFVLAFVDVDHLKAVNDSLGHAAGDRLLRTVADTIRANMRTYDMLIRFGGDEFICGLSELTLGDAARCFADANTSLERHQNASISVGFAELTGDDALEDLMVRADEAMYLERQTKRRPLSADGIA